MRILICSNGMPAADKAARMGGLLAKLCKAETTLLGIAEQPEDEGPLRRALEEESKTLQTAAVSPRIVVGAGDPVRQILRETASSVYDLVVIGTERKGHSGLYWRSRKTYELIKAIPPPVLVAMGGCEGLKRFLVCTGGKKFIGEAVRLAGKMAAATGASVTLLHVMAEPPAMYTDLVRLEEDLDQLLKSKSELGVTLSAQKAELEGLGVPVEVRIRHGLVLDQVFREAHEGRHDLIVTGSSQTTGIVRHYIMGDLTRSILNRSECPVLVARSGPMAASGNIFQLLRNFFFGQATSKS
jgi:nucleotide-binding universal stress UspA family protein